MTRIEDDRPPAPDPAARPMSFEHLEHLEQVGTVDDPGWSTVSAIGRALRARTPGLQGTLDAILVAAVDTIDGTDFAGVNVLRGESFEPQAVLGEAPNRLDQLQQATGTGPCIDASREQRVMRIDDVTSEARWPVYAELARTLGVQSILCVPMWIDQERLGSISFYSRAPKTFGPGQQRVAELLAVHAAVVLSDARRIENLGLALSSRDVIGQAKGILMERHRITADVAFRLLSAASQRMNRKLSVVAEELTSSGVLPN